MNAKTGTLSLVGVIVGIVVCTSCAVVMYSRFTFKQEPKLDDANHVLVVTLADDNKNLQQRVVKLEQQIFQANTQVQALEQTQAQLSAKTEAAAQAAARAQAQSAICRQCPKPCP